MDVKAALLLALLVSTGAHASDEWETMCSLVEELHGYSCVGIERPVIEWQRVFTPEGSYVGGSAIKISDRLRDGKKLAAIVHEMTHYLLNMLDVYNIPGVAAEVCASENVAWSVSNTLLIRRGERRNVAKYWWRLYNICDRPEEIA